MARDFLYCFPYVVLWVAISMGAFLRERETIGARSLVLYGLGNGVFWTLNEYWFHRLALHQVLYSMYHKIHHTYWNQAVFSQQWYILLAMAAYHQGMVYGFGQSVANKMFVFVPLYYVGFEWIHFVSHQQSREKIHLVLWIKQYHRMHHLAETLNYGITTPLWDWVFRTLHPDVAFGYKDIPISLVPLLWFIRAPLLDKTKNPDRLN
jgi:sterol desaturase/sphingolipid hydroxylase (fatty acid hydroxylase superfamily)